jgi:hypothetical protein
LPAAPPPLTQPYPIGSAQALLEGMLNYNRSPGDKFYLLLVPENDWPDVVEFDTFSEWVAAIKQQDGKPVHVFPFRGVYMPVTEGPLRFLHTPMGAVPLFEIPQGAAAARAARGWMGAQSLDPDDGYEIPVEEMQPNVSAADEIALPPPADEESPVH